jgi:hypothetical protein
LWRFGSSLDLKRAHNPQVRGSIHPSISNQRPLFRAACFSRSGSRVTKQPITDDHHWQKHGRDSITGSKLISKILPRFLRLFRVRPPTLPGRCRGPGRSAPSPPPDASRRGIDPGLHDGGRVGGTEGRYSAPIHYARRAYDGATPPFRLRRGCGACRPLLRFAEGRVLSCVDFRAGPGSLGVRRSVAPGPDWPVTVRVLSGNQPQRAPTRPKGPEAEGAHYHGVGPRTLGGVAPGSDLLSRGSGVRFLQARQPPNVYRGLANLSRRPPPRGAASG